MTDAPKLGRISIGEGIATNRDDRGSVRGGALVTNGSKT